MGTATALAALLAIVFELWKDFAIVRSYYDDPSDAPLARWSALLYAQIVVVQRRTTHALEGLRALPAELDRSHLGAAASLREGLEETLMLTRPGILAKPNATLQSTNPIESMIEIVHRTSRDVKRWQSGDMCLRWTAASMIEAEQAVPQDHRLQRPRQARRRRRTDLAARRAPLHTPTDTLAAIS